MSHETTPPLPFDREPIPTSGWTSPERKQTAEAEVAGIYGYEQMTLASEAHVFVGDNRRSAYAAAVGLWKWAALAKSAGSGPRYLATPRSGYTPDGEWMGYLFFGSPTASQDEVDATRQGIVNAANSYLDDLGGNRF